MEYLDTKGQYIGKQRYATPFDLSAARKGVSKHQTSVFSVVTVLQTSHAPENFRFLSDDTRADKVAGILTDENIAVHVHTMRIIIESKALSALRSVVSYYPFVDLDHKVLSLNEPYTILGHHMSELEALHERCKTSHHKGEVKPDENANPDDPLVETTAEHLELLHNYLKTKVYKGRIETEQELHRRNMCTFQMLWLLFRPGTTVYVESGGKLAAHVVHAMVHDTAILSDNRRDFGPHQILLWSLRFDGRFVGRSTTSVVVPPFREEREITSLKVFPTELFDKKDGGETKARLEAQGRQWFKLLRSQPAFYQCDPSDRAALVLQNRHVVRRKASEESMDSEDAASHKPNIRKARKAGLVCPSPPKHH